MCYQRRTYLRVFAPLEAHEAPAGVCLDVSRVQVQSHRAVRLRQVEQLQADVRHGSVRPHNCVACVVGQTVAVARHRVVVVSYVEALIAFRFLQVCAKETNSM